MSNPATSPGLAQRLTLIVGALNRAAAARASKNWSLAPTVLLLWSYLNRLAARFEGLAARLQAGPIPAPRVRKPSERPSALGRPRLPQGFGWLLRRVPEAIHYRSQLHHLLADPDMAALLAASPQAGRLLRPLCRMLGIRPDPDIPPTLFRKAIAPASAPPASAAPASAPAASPIAPATSGQGLQIEDGLAAIPGWPLPA